MAWLSGQQVCCSRTPTRRAGPGSSARTTRAHRRQPRGPLQPINPVVLLPALALHRLDSQTFLDWVAKQGGPKHAPGLRDELLAQVMDHSAGQAAADRACSRQGRGVCHRKSRKNNADNRLRRRTGTSALLTFKMKILFDTGSPRN
jgi:cytochrome c551/c552